jgi:predicted RNase H-like nuclease (RuvC/YqgF family)
MSGANRDHAHAHTLTRRRFIMHETPMRDEMERLERTVHRVFARVSVLEARVNELERELESERRQTVRASDRPRLLDALARTA